jgi:protein TonB
MVAGLSKVFRKNRVLLFEAPLWVAFWGMPAYNPSPVVISRRRLILFMSRASQEKLFAITLALSLILHIGLFAVLALLPPDQQKAAKEPVMVDLMDLPELKQPQPKDQREPRRLSEAYRRVPTEIAPRGETERDKPAPQPELRPSRPSMTQPSPPMQPAEPSRPREQGELPGESLFRAKEQRTSDLARLYPDASKLARIEESYRKRYRDEVKEGDARFLNSDDIQFGSFLRRFETAVYGVWRYPPEAAKLGIEGVTPVKITFNRKGEIEKVELLESSGSRILDDEVRRTLSLVGPVGAFPRGYNKESFNLIAFFHYGIVGGSIRGRLY